MKPLASVSLLFITILISITSCQKEVSHEVGPGGGGGGGGGGGNNYNPSCNNKVITAALASILLPEINSNTIATVIRLQRKLLSRAR